MIHNSELSEDVFQETFIYFFKNIKDNRELLNPAAFLMSIARNLCLKFYRDKNTTVPLDTEQFFVDERNNFENNEMFSLIVKALQVLDEKYREAFILREFDGMAYDEIAKICDTSVTNAKSRVFRAHKQIIEILKPYMKDLAK
jgi:RNA polymerase sigma-70 factor (ECF subfamily)